MKKDPSSEHHPAAFINNIAEEGTKEEAIQYLQETWNELCEVRKLKDKVTDYHDFSYRGSSKEHCQRLGIGDLYVNAAICKHCGYFIRSRNRRDFVRCKCGAIAVDGGSMYARRIGNMEHIESIIEVFDWAKEEANANSL